MNAPMLGIPYDDFGPNISAAAAAYSTTVVNTVLFEVLGFSVTVANVLWDLVTPQAASHVGFGIYAVTDGSATRGARLADTGPVSSAAGTLKTTPFLAPVTLPCGIYCMAFTTDNAAVSVMSVTPGGAGVTTLNVYNQTPEVFLGTAANAAAGGQLPPTLGLITGVGGLKFPTIMLSN